MSGGEPRHPGRLILAVMPELVVLLVLAVAFASFQYDAARRLGWASDPVDPSEIEPPTGVVLPDLMAPAPVAEPALAGRVRPAQVRAVLAPYLRDRDLGRHVVAAVADGAGDTLFTHGAGAATPASTTKLLTVAAALESLGADRTFATSVLPGPRANEIVLVGGGDPYLTRKPVRDDYPDAVDLRTLAQHTAAALDVRRVRLSFDDSLFAGPDFSPAWPESYELDGVVAPIGALWVDQGAERPGFGFEQDPAQVAAETFATELARAGVKVGGRPTRVTADPSGAPLASVESPPVWQLAERVLLVSDNEGAEVLARHVAIEEGLPGSFAGAVDGVAQVLDRLGVPLRGGDVIHDGSGLSRRNRLTAGTLLDVLSLGADDRHPSLRTLVAGLPVAGYTGSLADRFAEGPGAGPGRVRAKTGTLSGVHGLAGVVTTADGTTLTFVVLTDRVRLEDTLDARETLDAMAAALATIEG